jgi:hypothetical protein
MFIINNRKFSTWTIGNCRYGRLSFGELKDRFSFLFRLLSWQCCWLDRGFSTCLCKLCHRTFDRDGGEVLFVGGKRGQKCLLTSEEHRSLESLESSLETSANSWSRFWNLETFTKRFRKIQQFHRETTKVRIPTLLQKNHHNNHITPNQLLNPKIRSKLRYTSLTMKLNIAIDIIPSLLAISIRYSLFQASLHFQDC